MITSIDKFIVAAVGLAVTLGLIDSQLGEIIGGTLTALAVYIVPNA
jgi:hypothetical protein